MFSSKDNEFMSLAIEQARKSLYDGNYPVGAVLVIDSKVFAFKNNTNQKTNSWINHAEFQLLLENAEKIKEFKTFNSARIELFTTLEPCIMCLGTSIMNRIDRIVYACEDPHGGATSIDPKVINEYYHDRWPKIEKDLMKKDSLEMLIQFMENQKSDFWKKVLILFNEKHCT